MKVLNLDIQKMRRLNASGIDINKLAPAVFEDGGEGGRGEGGRGESVGDGGGELVQPKNSATPP